MRLPGGTSMTSSESLQAARLRDNDGAGARVKSGAGGPEDIEGSLEERYEFRASPMLPYDRKARVGGECTPEVANL